MKNVTREDIWEQVRSENVKYIRLQFTDMMGTIKNVEIPTSELDDAFDGKVMFDGSSIEGFVRIKETDMYLVPDLNTWLILDFEQTKYGKVARLICDVYNTDGTPFDGDPRLILKKVMKRAEKLGFSAFNIGFEPEFYLFKQDDERRIKLTDYGSYFDQAPFDPNEDVRRDIVLELEQLGFRVEASHHEVGPGQHEVNFKYANAVEACDNLQTFKAVVKNNARKNGMYATFMPKPVKDLAGNGMHTNCSLFDSEGNNVFYDKDNKLELSDTCYKFMAGIMKHARPITCITNPTVNSYKRLTPGFEAPCYIAWSPQNRSSFIRIPASRKTGTRIEIRSVDPTCNPYLALAVILEAGLEGIEENLTCPNPTFENLFKLTRKEREDAGIENLPNNLYDAIKEVQKSTIIKKALGEHTFEKFLFAVDKVWEEYRVEVHDWELRKYLHKY